MTADQNKKRIDNVFFPAMDRHARLFFRSPDHRITRFPMTVHYRTLEFRLRTRR